MIAITDYGMGNLRSVQKALERLGARAVITGEATVLREADKVVLPGVGAFKDAMAELDARGLVPALREAARDKPFLGICLGLQLLFTESEEGGLHPGLDVLAGRIVRFPSASPSGGEKLKVPHMGWNSLRFQGGSPLFSGLSNGVHAYFVHSYYAQPGDASVVTAWTDYGVTFASAVMRPPVYATQFHPEKSQAVGLRMLENFINL
ncbi:MAG: imidazole glycerol phosphate synthase subunit HisH [Planctomycetes bacterium]|nr:imidazole glycerol phosphate synthase subunit HisH [Planctomycetota bacterium]